ncbi:MAG: hypothetical protein MI975_17505 [Cytophagales bacterium]|nr:hypothetical protein [Cytophagales bacterium]
MSQELFNSIAEGFSSDPDVHLGKMMSAPGLKFKDKVFAFFNKDAMGFRLGPNFDPEKMGIKNAKLLSPFKKKPPLKGWFIIDMYESDTWKILAEMALEFTKKLK